MSYTKSKLRNALVSLFQREGMTLEAATKKAKKHTDQMHIEVTQEPQEPTTTAKTSATKTTSEKANKPQKLTLRKKIANRIESSGNCHAGIRRRLFEGLSDVGNCHKSRRGGGHC